MINLKVRMLYQDYMTITNLSTNPKLNINSRRFSFIMFEQVKDFRRLRTKSTSYQGTQDIAESTCSLASASQGKNGAGKSSFIQSNSQRFLGGSRHDLHHLFHEATRWHHHAFSNNL
ncbi:hypothetical protein OH492_09505 [Vibrio chagasii]|nr:hypothetical protein [Vibrio chagasii]